MAVTVSYPGVYIDEVSSGVHTITSVSTSIAAFFGRTSKGPLNKAVRCLSLADFLRNFGAPHPQSDLSHSVRHFFANGGTDCYIVRLAKAGSTQKASVTLRSLVATQSVLVATAKAEGEWGNTVRLEVDYATASPHESFNLRVIQEEGGSVVASEVHPNLSMNPISPRFAPSFVSQSSALIDLKLSTNMGDPTLPLAFINVTGNSFSGYSQSRRPFTGAVGAVATALNGLITPVAPTAPQTSFVIRVNDSLPVTVDLTGWAVPSNFVTMGSELTTRINAELATLSPAQTVTATVDDIASVGRVIHIVSTTAPFSSVRISRASNRDIAAALMLGHEQGGIETTRFSNFRPAPNAVLVRLGDPATPGVLGSLNALSALPQGGAGAIAKVTINGIDTAVNLKTAPPDTNPWFMNTPAASSATGDNDGVREKLRIIMNAINNNAALAFRAELWGYQLALRAKGGGVNELPSSTPSTTIAAFDNALIQNTRQYTLGLAGTSAFSTAGVAGKDGDAPLLSDYVGNPVDQTGFHALDPVDLFNLMVLPPDAEVVAAEHLKLWSPAANYCAGHRAFLLIDSPVNWTSADGRPAVAGNTALIGDLNVSGTLKTYAAVFYPRVVFDNAGLNKKTGASGAMAGLMARTDATRGVWKAPAGIEADVRDVLGIDVRLTDNENGVLNKKAVNCLRVFPNGLVAWGARTLAGDDDFGSEWKYIPVRRLALNIEESLFRGTKWVVFEPNDEPLWAKIRLNINAYMMSLFRQGAFQGTSPKEAFFVKCDKDTTTQDDRNKGIVNIEVGFAPLKPAEFVVIKIQQIAGDL